MSKLQRRRNVKTELSGLTTTVLHESVNIAKFGLKGTANLMEVVFNETQSLAYDSRVSGLSDQLESTIEAVQSLVDFGHSQEAIDKEIAKLKDEYVANVLALAGIKGASNE